MRRWSSPSRPMWSRAMRDPTEAELDAAAGELVAHMREQLQRAEMDDSEAAVRAACRERLRTRLALCERRSEADRP
jgi:hypothetical protein